MEAGPQILIVDDDAASRKILARMLAGAGYLCREIDVWAARIVDEVHAIAREYGWTEETILNLSPERRQLYMERIGA